MTHKSSKDIITNQLGLAHMPGVDASKTTTCNHNGTLIPIKSLFGIPVNYQEIVYVLNDSHTYLSVNASWSNGV